MFLDAPRNNSIHIFLKKGRKKILNLRDIKKQMSRKVILTEKKKYSCSEPLAFKSQRVGYQSNQKLLHRCQQSNN